MTQSKVQHRGHCQCCLKEHAVLSSNGLMAKHGYQVEPDAWSDYKRFSGVCDGQYSKPLEQDHTVADAVIGQYENRIKKNTRVLKLIECMDDHTLKTTMIHVTRNRERIQCAYCEATQDEQRSFMFNLQQHIRKDASTIQMFRDAIRNYYGQNLINVQQVEADKAKETEDRKTAKSEVNADPVPIHAGDRIFHKKKGILTAMNSPCCGIVEFWNPQTGTKEEMDQRHWIRTRESTESVDVSPTSIAGCTQPSVPVRAGDVLQDPCAGTWSVNTMHTDYSVCLDQYAVQYTVPNEWLSILRYMEEHPDIVQQSMGVYENPAVIKTIPRPKRRKAEHHISTGDMVCDFNDFVYKAVYVNDATNQVIIQCIGQGENTSRPSDRLFSWDMDYWLENRQNMSRNQRQRVAQIAESTIESTKKHRHGMM